RVLFRLAVVGTPSTSTRSFTATRGPVPAPSSIVIHVDMGRTYRFDAGVGECDRASSIASSRPMLEPSFQAELHVAGSVDARARSMNDAVHIASNGRGR